MSVAGDFNVNSMQISSDSFMEVVKETILKQDLTFRMQVHELHRVYRAQNFLVKDLGCRELFGRNSLSTIPQLPMFPLKDVTEYASPPDESRLYYTNKVALTTFSSQDLSENYKSKHHRFQKRPLDLQLSADEFINNAVEETPKNWIILDQSEGPVELSLGLREEKKRKRGTTGKWIDKATQACYQNVIDLEDSDEQESDSCTKYASLGKCASPSIYSKGDRDMVSFISAAMSPKEKKNPVVVISKCLSTEEQIECCQVQASPSKGNREDHGVHIHYNLLTEEQQPASGQGWKLDLNEPFIDDSSQDSHIPSLEHSPIVGSASSSTGPIVASIEETFCLTPSTEENIRCSNKASEIIQHTRKMDQTSSVFVGKSKSMDPFPIENSKQSIELADGTAGPETMSISDGPGSCCTEQKNDDIDASKSRVIVSSLDDSECKLTSAGLMSSEKIVTENIARSCTSHYQNGVQEGQGDKSPVSWKSCCTSDNDSSSAKSIQSGLQYAAQKGHLKTNPGSQFVDLLPDQRDTGTANPEDATIKNIDQEEESMEVLQRAAELLIQLSSAKNLSSDQDSYSKAGSKETENKNGKQPQHPADSFELMVLQLPEDNIDDECTSSKPLVSNDTETTDVSRKFRRGRRMKDFQKEILPSLASLSVQEIREDINIFEGVLRSREYRRTRAKMAAREQDWSAAVKKSRRSKTNVRRRIFA